MKLICFASSKKARPGRRQGGGMGVDMWLNASSFPVNSLGSLTASYLPHKSACAEPWRGCCVQGNILREGEERVYRAEIKLCPRALPGLWVILLILLTIRNDSESSSKSNNEWENEGPPQQSRLTGHFYSVF